MVDGIDGIKLSQGLVLGLGDFELIRVIGRGSYAKVLLVRLKKNDEVYAMKVVKKELVHDDEVRPFNRILIFDHKFYYLCLLTTLDPTVFGLEKRINNFRFFPLFLFCCTECDELSTYHCPEWLHAHAALYEYMTDVI